MSAFALAGVWAGLLIAASPAAVATLEIPGGIWSLTPPTALIGLGVLLYWMIATGRLIPKSSHEREVNLLKERGDEWQETARAERAVNKEIREQNTLLIESTRTAAKFFAEASVNVEDTRESYAPKE